jgi:hypothetical protein
MLNNTNVDYYKKIKIDNGFPKKKLVKIMKPYLLLYLTSKYSLNLEKQFKSNRLLKNKLSRFFKFNPIFGRKKVDLNNVYSQEKKRMITKKTSYYVDKHISFYTNKKDDFLESHIKLQDDLEEEEDNNLPSVHEISDDDEETNSEYSESILDDDEEEINNNENQENISVINTNNISNPFLENSLFIRNYLSSTILFLDNYPCCCHIKSSLTHYMKLSSRIYCTYTNISSIIKNLTISYSTTACKFRYIISST